MRAQLCLHVRVHQVCTQTKMSTKTQTQTQTQTHTHAGVTTEQVLLEVRRLCERMDKMEKGFKKVEERLDWLEREWVARGWVDNVDE